MADKDKQPIQEAKMEIHFGEENPKINLDKLFLISLGTIMTLFTWVTHKLGLLCNISKDGL